MFPEKLLGYTTKFLEAEQYGKNGYEAQYQRVVAVKNNKEPWIGNFQKVVSNNPPPPPPPTP